MKDKRNPVLWDIEVGRLEEVAYSLYIAHIEELNDHLHLSGKEYRASYSTLSDFLKYSVNKKEEYFEDAKILIRIDKIRKIVG